MIPSLNKENFIDQLSIDCVIFGYQDKALKVLVPQLKFLGDFWSVPGGFVYQDEDIDDAAHRILFQRTGIKEIYLQQFHVFGRASRNSISFMDKLLAMNETLFPDEASLKNQYEWFNKRFVSIGYYALVDMKKVVPQKFDIDKSIGWYNVRELPELIIDHNEIVEKALVSLRQNFDEKLIAFNLLPETFTMKELQELYESVFDKPLARNNFQKKMLDMDILERLEKKFTGAANKAPFLYKFKQREPQAES